MISYALQQYGFPADNGLLLEMLLAQGPFIVRDPFSIRTIFLNEKHFFMLEPYPRSNNYHASFNSSISKF